MDHPQFIVLNQKGEAISIHRGSYMSAHVLFNLLNELGKRAFDLFFAMSLINSIIQEH